MSQEQLLQGSCHCGAVRLTLPSAPDQAIKCNCSICRRLGGLWAYYEFGTVRIEGHPENTAEYIWGDKTLRNIRCKTCGCATHWEPLVPEAGSKHGVNLNNFDPRLQENPFRYAGSMERTLGNSSTERHRRSAANLPPRRRPQQASLACGLDACQTLAAEDRCLLSSCEYVPVAGRPTTLRLRKRYCSVQHMRGDLRRRDVSLSERFSETRGCLRLTQWIHSLQLQ